MTDETNLPSPADLDAKAEEQKAQQATAPAKAAHDALVGDLTKAALQKPDLTPGPETDAAIAYVESKGYSHEKAIEIVKDNGVDTILAAKSHEESAARPTNQPRARPAKVAAPDSVVSRHGEVFNPEIHAQLPTGDPKTDSTGRFILKQHDYSPRTPNVPGGK